MVKNRVLIVTGMHRSGTSVITHWLSKCGLHVGDALAGAETGNEQGHFEDLDFLHAHQTILKSHRLTDEGYTDPVRQLLSSETDILNDIIAYKNSVSRQWGWKDPRTCLFLGTYRTLIPEAFYFVVLRDYQSVVSSLVRRIYKRTEKKYASRTGLSKFIWEHIKKKRRMNMLLKKYSQRYLKVWITYNETILQHLRQLPAEQFIVTDYNMLHSNDATVFQHITRQWGFALNFFNFKSIYQEGLMHEAVVIDRYIKDKTLLSRAAAIEGSLREMIFFNTAPRQMAAV